MELVVDTHTHTLASGHAYSTIMENAAAAEQKGLALFCNTDHGPRIPGAPYYWYFSNQRVIPRFLSNVGVIRGIEANILDTDGNIDLPIEADSYLDWLMAGFHEPVIIPTNREDHTLALENLIKGGRVDAISHLGNPRFPFDIEAVLLCAKQHNVAIELNNSSLIGESRVGSEANCDTIARLGTEIGVYFTTGSDAHFCADIGKLNHSAALLEKYQVSPDKVITSSASRFLNFLRLRGKAPIPEFAELY